jgi:2-keto-4-pentenoate hydratase/2-oxohepta-3-ene-1,7-dioic acid hydratase in catechol pathway
MKLVSFTAGGIPRFGIAMEGGVVDLTTRTGAGILLEALAQQKLDEMGRYSNDAIDFLYNDISIDPPILRPWHIFCVGTNYAEHLREVQSAGISRSSPQWPPLFVRFPETLVGHRQALILPKVSDKFDYEGELAVIIGREGRHIKSDRALQHVAGYSCFNDGSIRDWQFQSAQVTAGKNFASSGSVGPWIVTADEIPDPQRLRLITQVNSKIVQDGSTANMIFGVTEIISYISRLVTLRPGDIIATGTPAGVGFSRRPPLFLNEGDICEVEIESIGLLSNEVRKERETDNHVASE